MRRGFFLARQPKNKRVENKNEQTEQNRTERAEGEEKKKKERKSLVKIRICNDNVRNHQFKQQEIVSTERMVSKYEKNKIK